MGRSGGGALDSDASIHHGFFFLTIQPRNRQTNKLTNEPKNKMKIKKLSNVLKPCAECTHAQPVVSHVSQRCLNPPVSPSRHGGNLSFVLSVFSQKKSASSPAKTRRLSATRFKTTSFSVCPFRSAGHPVSSFVDER